MGIVSIRIPQIGEGLQEARVVAFLKQPGDAIRRDEPIYQMETDKAVMDVESPLDGVLVKWLAAPDDVVAIGAELAMVETTRAGGSEAEVGSSPVEAAPHKEETLSMRTPVPPRTRAYAKEKGISDEELEQMAGSTSKLMPSHIDDFLASKSGSRQFHDAPVPSKQRILNSRLVRGSHLVVPGTISVAADWAPIERERAKTKAAAGDFQPSSFTFFAFAVARAVQNHPRIRTSLMGEETFRTYSQLSLGIAVALPGDELLLAVVEGADNLGWREFALKTKAAIDLARSGKDQVHEAVTLSLTNMQSFGLRDATPVVVPPAAATIFLGESYIAPASASGEYKKVCNLALTFDHRVMNGVGAAQFLAEVKKNVERIEELVAL